MTPETDPFRPIKLKCSAYLMGCGTTSHAFARYDRHKAVFDYSDGGRLVAHWPEDKRRPKEIDAKQSKNAEIVLIPVYRCTVCDFGERSVGMVSIPFEHKETLRPVCPVCGFKHKRTKDSILTCERCNADFWVMMEHGLYSTEEFE